MSLDWLNQHCQPVTRRARQSEVVTECPPVPVPAPEKRLPFLVMSTPCVRLLSPLSVTARGPPALAVAA